MPETSHSRALYIFFITLDIFQPLYKIFYRNRQQIMTSQHQHIPLAERMRPRNLEEFVAQDHLLAEEKILWRLMQEGNMPSLLLWGPPGVGKTTLAKILAQSTDAFFEFFSAVLSGVKEVREIVDKARQRKQSEDRATILFVDEIHRFNKSQQDGFLPHVESGLITLIGATTENPSFHVIAPLLSRCRVLVLNGLEAEDLTQIVRNALADEKRGLGKFDIIIDPNALSYLVAMSDGDARVALNSLELAFSLSRKEEDGKYHIGMDTVEESLQRKSLRYDADGDEHYNLISALHKSLRDSDPDGSLYWLARMLMAGEDPLYLARRLIRFASEDIGIADPAALPQTIAARDSYQMLGSPEGELALAQAVVYLATAPKSNAVYAAYNAVRNEIKKSGSLPVPMHIRNAPTRLMKDVGFGKDYKYAHDDPDAVVLQSHLPEPLEKIRFYQPTNRGYESLVRDRLAKWRKILQDRQQTEKK